MEEKRQLVGLDSAVADILLDAFSRDEKLHLLDSFDNIMENIVDVYEGMAPNEIMAARNLDYQDLFNEVERLLPSYVPLLRASVDDLGDEAYMDEAKTIAVLGVDKLDAQCFPKLLLDDGTRGFAFMQIAAFKAGIKDDNLRLWYLLLQLIMGSSLHEMARQH